MVRLGALLLWTALALFLLLPFVRRRPLAPPSRASALDELVKDPVCQTYVLRSRAVSRRFADGAHYFCSAECARRYAGAIR